MGARVHVIACVCETVRVHVRVCPCMRACARVCVCESGCVTNVRLLSHIFPVGGHRSSRMFICGLLCMCKRLRMHVRVCM